MSPRTPPEAAGVQIERPGDAAFDARKRPLPQLRGGDLDGQRNAIDAGANPLDGDEVCNIGLEAMVGEPAAFDERRTAADCPERSWARPSSEGTS